MGAFLTGLLENRILVAAVLAWFVAQCMKVILTLILDGKFQVERFVGSGGMPSAHSATVGAMASASAVHYGSGSFQFAVTAMLAFIVMYDACHVRLETGKQAIVIKELRELLQDLLQDMGKSLPTEEKLRELIGHTLPQVLAGALIGILVGIGIALF